MFVAVATKGWRCILKRRLECAQRLYITWWIWDTKCLDMDEPYTSYGWRAENDEQVGHGWKFWLWEPLKDFKECGTERKTNR